VKQEREKSRVERKLKMQKSIEEENSDEDGEQEKPASSSIKTKLK